MAASTVWQSDDLPTLENDDMDKSGMDFQDALEQAMLEINTPHILKDKQVEILKQLFFGKDVLALLPTGYGKSLIYQLAPFVLKHRTEWVGNTPICIVVTPLNAIMQEQILRLGEMGISACGLDMTGKKVTTWKQYESSDEEEEQNSDEENEEPQKRFILTNGSMDDLKMGKFNLVYAHPEALLSTEEGQDLMRSPIYQQNVFCIAIDEGHLINQWGLDFRKDFLRLCELITLFDTVPHLVLTATASPESVKLTIRKLQLHNCVTISISPDRPNIVYKKQLRHNNNIIGLQKILDQLCQELLEKGASFPLTLVYTDLESIQYSFRYFKHKVPDAVGYHGPVSCETRRYAQFHHYYDQAMKLHIIRDLSKENPTTRIVFASIALGMGLDTRSIRRIIHFKVPKSMEQYIQETGRAGRDGHAAEATIFYNNRDIQNPSKGIVHPMRKYCKSTVECLRGLLLAHLGHQKTQGMVSCCSICTGLAELESQNTLEN